MRKRWMLVGLFLIVVGCSQSLPLRTLSPKEQKAVDAAQAFLKQQGLRWGQPYQVKLVKGEWFPNLKGGNVYWIAYPTSESEMKLVGERVVLVHADTSTVRLMPRR